MSRRYDGRSGREPYYGGRRGGRSGDDDPGNCLIMIILALVLMPLAGLYLIIRRDGDEGTKVVGWVLLVVGAIIWIYIAANYGK